MQGLAEAGNEGGAARATAAGIVQAASATDKPCRRQWNHNRSRSKLVKIIRPDLHHVDALGPELRGVHVRKANLVFFLMRELPLDGVGIPSPHFIEER